MEDQPAEAPPLARALSYFCDRRRWSPQRLAAAHGFAGHRQIHGYMSGDRPLSREYLEHLLAPLEIPPEAIDTFLFSDSLIVLDPPPQAASPVALDREEQQAIDQTVMTAGWAVAEALRRELIRQAKKEKVEAARLQARELGADLKTADSQERRELVEIFPGYRSWALAELLCQESIRAAAHKIEIALELGPTERARADGYLSGIGENIVEQRYSVDEAFNAWLNSPGHRDNILDPDYRDLGLGLAVGAGYDAAPGGYRVVWVQSFGLGE